MEHCFTPEEEATALQLLESLQVGREAVDTLLEQLESKNFSAFAGIAATLVQLITSIQQAAAPFREKLDTVMLPITCECMLYTLDTVCKAIPSNLPKAEMKLRYELAPTLEEAYMQFYYWAYVYTHPDREELYYRKDMYELASNPYANAALETGEYKYEVSFTVTGYNHLDYTKMCVESLLKNIPRGLNYELILFDNGSVDGTEAFFESICPTKLIKAKTNHGIGSSALRAREGKYSFSISNDVIVLPNAIENSLECIQSADDIARVVPTTPNVSNLQTIYIQYRDADEMVAAARQNNGKNPFRWEQRTRLCNPLNIDNMHLCYSKEGLCHNGYLNKNCNMFPDDRFSLLCRRAGYKMYLAKDAYCHHFGSVTLKDEIARYNEQKFYDDGRQKFYEWFGIDPWGTGFCYDPIFMERVVGEHQGHTEVLGINCGMGSNSLKIKEQIKEYCHNTNCTLTNVTDDERFFLDLRGVSDAAETVTKIKAFKELLYQKQFDYIVWETPFLTQFKFETLLTLCLEHLTNGGLLLLKKTEQVKGHITVDNIETGSLEGGWITLQKK